MRLHRIFFLLTLLFLPSQLGKHFWPDWAMVLGRRIDYLSPTVYITDIFIGLMIVTALPDLVKALRLTRVSPGVRRHTMIALVCLGIIIGANIVSAHEPFRAIWAWGKSIEMVAVSLYIIWAKPTMRFVANSLFVAALYSSLLAIHQFALQHSVGGAWWILGERSFTLDTPGIARQGWCHVLSIMGCPEVLRAYATFPHPNVLGGFLAVFMPLLANEVFPYVKSPGRNTSMAIVGMFVVSFLYVLALLLTFSQSAWLVSVVGITYIAWHRLGHASFARGAIVIACIALLFVIFRFSDANRESFAFRKELMERAIHIIATFPLQGVGLGNFLYALPGVFRSRAVLLLQPVHNIYLLTVSEVGLGGSLVLGGIVVWFVRLFIRYNGVKFLRQPTPLHIFMLLSLLALGLVDHYLVSVQQGQIMLAVGVGLFFAHALGTQ